MLNAECWAVIEILGTEVNVGAVPPRSCDMREHWVAVERMARMALELEQWLVTAGAESRWKGVSYEAKQKPRM